MSVHTVVNDAFGVLNALVAVWLIRGGRRRFGPGWTAGWSGVAAWNVAGLWWHSWWPPLAAAVCALVAVVARARRVRAARLQSPADADLTGTPR